MTPREELEQLRAQKRLAELEAKASGNTDQSEPSLWHQAIDPIAAGVAGTTNKLVGGIGAAEDPAVTKLRQEHPLASTIGEMAPGVAADAALGGVALKGAGALIKGTGGLIKYALPAKARAVLSGIEALLGKAPKEATEIGTARPALDAMKASHPLGSRPAMPQDAGRLQELLKLTTSGGKVGTNLPSDILELESIPASAAPRTGPGRLTVPQDMPVEATTPIETSPSLGQALEATQKRPMGKRANFPRSNLSGDELEKLAGGAQRPTESLGDYFKRLNDAAYKATKEKYGYK